MALQTRRRFDDLPEEMVTEILSYLPNKELLLIESVSKSVQRAVRRVLTRVRVIACDKPDLNGYFPTPTAICSHAPGFNDKFRGILVRRSSSVAGLLSRCSRVECLDLRYFNCVDSLLHIVKSCPHLECLWLREFEVPVNKWKKFAEEVGPRLRHLNVTCNYDVATSDRLDTLIKACVGLERCHLEEIDDFALKMLTLNQLNPNQTAISYVTDSVPYSVNGLIQGFVDVMVRAESLWVFFNILQEVAQRHSHFPRLRHLTIATDFYLQPSDSTIYLEALETLKLDLVDDATLDLLAACRLKKLRTLHLKDYDITEEGFETLFNMFKDVKQLILSAKNSPESTAPGHSLVTLRQLEEVEVKIETNNYFDELEEGDHFRTLIGMLQTVSLINTVRKMRVVLKFRENVTVSRAMMQQLASAVGQLKRTAQRVRVVVELVYKRWIKRKRSGRLIKLKFQPFFQQPEVTRIQEFQRTRYGYISDKKVFTFA